MKATYKIINDDGGFRMTRKTQGKDEKDVLGKGEILADFITRLVSTIDQMSDGDTITMEFEANIK